MSERKEQKEGYLIPKKAGLISLAVVLVIILVFFFVPFKEVPYSVAVPYQDTVTYKTIEAYETTEPYQTTANKNAVFFDKVSFGLEQLHNQPYLLSIDLTGKSWAIVRGSAAALAGGDFIFYAFDQKNYDAFSNNQTYQPLLAPGSLTNFSFSFVPAASGNYWLVFINPFSYPTNKLIQFSARWDWQEPATATRTVTKVREVEKQLSVSKERIETRYQRMSVAGMLGQ